MRASSSRSTRTRPRRFSRSRILGSSRTSSSCCPRQSRNCGREEGPRSVHLSPPPIPGRGRAPVAPAAPAKLVPGRAAPEHDPAAPRDYRLRRDRRARGDVDLPLDSDGSVLPRVLPVLVLHLLPVRPGGRHHRDCFGPKTTEQPATAADPAADGPGGPARTRRPELPELRRPADERGPIRNRDVPVLRDAVPGAVSPTAPRG